MSILIILIIVGALVYIVAGLREDGERVSELGRLTFFAALLAYLLTFK